MGSNTSALSSMVLRLPKPRTAPKVQPLPPPKFGKRITMLSIDGGGIRGLIPAVVLGSLEEKLQAIEKNEDARIADYFDVIAGTSTGALVATMLVTPDEHKRPLFPAADIVKFYKDNGPRIVPEQKGEWIDYLGEWAAGNIRLWRGPKYDGAFLRRTIRELTSDKTLAETLTRVVVPTFDVYRLAPVIFSSFQDHQTNKQKIRKEVKPNLSDVCIGTSAAPTFFPSHFFENDSPEVFHLIDGGVAANNPTMAAITRVTREQLLDNGDFHSDGVDYKKYLVLSVGTGAAMNKGTYTADDCAKWGILNWLSNESHHGHSHPLLDIFSHASDFLVDLHVRMLLHKRGQLGESYEQNSDVLHSDYLRIQAQGSLFEEPVLSMDMATRENMESLVNIGNKLLREKVARVDLTLGTYQTDKNARTNDKELDLFATHLVDERNQRLRAQAAENEKEKRPTTDEGTSLPGGATSSETDTTINEYDGTPQVCEEKSL